MPPKRVLLGCLALVAAMALVAVAVLLWPPARGPLYAVEVTAYDVCDRQTGDCDPANAVGPPDAPVSGDRGFISLRANGSIVAKMEGKFGDGPGADLRVYEVGRLQSGVDEQFDVFVSLDGANWLQVADDAQNDAGQSYASIDISPSSGPFRYVKVKNSSSSTSGSHPGADIDAIEALYPRR